MRQTESLSVAPATQQQAAHGSGLAEADGRDGGSDVLHGVVDGEAGGDAAAGAVDVEVDVLVRVFGFEEEELGDDAGRGRLFYFAVEADDAFFEEPREDVVGVPAASLIY